ncbi:MAG: hypothetical protein AB7J30_20265 [Hyphomicrobium sp.]|uniref:hypothetical protein n=1 Tax=Hyphomicrobium sp. TaxID=82 RepID=UPI003D0C0133
MSKRILTAVLALGAAACITAPAEARHDHSPVASLYDADGRSAAKPQRAKRKTAARQKGAKTAKYRANKKSYRSRKASASGRKTRLASRAVTASHSGGGGASRGCLQPAAAALLARIESQFGPVQVISTCRPGARIAGSGKPSKHGFGLAVDFDAGGRKGAIVNWLLANHHSGGTMTYARMSHIHVDIGPRFVSLGSGGGRRRG